MWQIVIKMKFGNIQLNDMELGEMKLSYYIIIFSFQYITIK